MSGLTPTPDYKTIFNSNTLARISCLRVFVYTPDCIFTPGYNTMVNKLICYNIVLNNIH